MSKLRNGPVTCHYIFGSPVACQYSQCRMSNLRNDQDALSILGVKGHVNVLKGWSAGYFHVIVLNTYNVHIGNVVQCKGPEKVMCIYNIYSQFSFSYMGPSF